MLGINIGFWRNLRPVWRKPLAYQPFIILTVLLGALLWTVAAGLLCTARFVAVVAGETAFIGGIVLCLVGFGYIGLPVGVAGLVAARIAA